MYKALLSLVLMFLLVGCIGETPPEPFIEPVISTEPKVSVEPVIPDKDFIGGALDINELGDLFVDNGEGEFSLSLPAIQSSIMAREVLTIYIGSNGEVGKKPRPVIKQIQVNDYAIDVDETYVLPLQVEGFPIPSKHFVFDGDNTIIISYLPGENLFEPMIDMIYGFHSVSNNKNYFSNRILNHLELGSELIEVTGSGSSFVAEYGVVLPAVPSDISVPDELMLSIAGNGYPKERPWPKLIGIEVNGQFTEVEQIFVLPLQVNKFAIPSDQFKFDETNTIKLSYEDDRNSILPSFEELSGFERA